MAHFTIEINGQDRDQSAHELERSIIDSQGEAQVFSETEKVLDPMTATAIVSAVMSGIQAAGVVWTWWQARRESQTSQTTRVTIRTAKGRVIELSGINKEQLETILREDD